jgi:hypothetical protein
MPSDLYRVDSRIIPPICLTLVSGAVLIILEGASKQGLLTLLVLAPFFYLGAEILARTVRMDEDGITISKLLRSVSLDWDDIQYVDGIRTGNKVFLILHVRAGRPVFLTNTIQPFSDLVGRIVERTSRDNVSERVGQILTDPPSKVGPVIQAWIACFVIAGVLAGRMLGYP